MIRPGVFRKRPATIEAWHWDGSAECGELIADWVESNGGFAALGPAVNRIYLGPDIFPVQPGDWVIRDKFGDFWPLDDVTFPAVYESLL